MVTALPRPFIAFWNSFVLDEHARLPVPGMAVLLDQALLRQHPVHRWSTSPRGRGTSPPLWRFLGRHLFPAGSMLLTDWGPTRALVPAAVPEPSRTGKLRVLALLVAKAQNQPFATYSEFANTLMEASEEEAIQTITRAIETGKIVLLFQAIVNHKKTPCYYEVYIY